MNIPYLVIGGLVLIGVFVFIKLYFFIYFLFNYKYKQLTREKTLRTLKDKYNVTKEVCGGGILGNLIGGFIVILVGINLISVIPKEISQISNNVTGTTSTIYSMITVFFALGIMVAGIALAVGGLRNAGLR